MRLNRVAANLVPILYEDEHVLVVDKPAGLAVASSRDRRHADLHNLLPDLLVAAGHDGPEGPGKGLFPVERLDRFASGPVLFAKSEEIANALGQALAGPTATHRYVAVVRGRPRQRYLLNRAADRPRPHKSGRKPLNPKSPGPGPRLWLELQNTGHDLSLVRFEIPPTAQADVRRELFLMGIPILNDVRHSRRSDRRQSGRYFLHRAEVRVPHPVTGRSLAIKSPAPEAFRAAVQGRLYVGEHLRTALATRLSCLLDPGVEALRLLTGQYEGVPGLVVEAFGPVLVLDVQQGRFQGDADLLRHIGHWYVRTLGVSSVYLRQSPKDRSGSQGRPSDADLLTPLVGAPADEEFVIQERNLRFRIRPTSGPNVGLFLDQRENRRRIRELADGRRVLNLFAYTCGFSVAAAAGRAASVTSVDLSKSRLETGKENFRINGLPLEPHTFVCSEVFAYFARARRQDRLFDLIIIDPPTFARAKHPKRSFTLEKDLRPLVAEALTLLAPGGLLLLSTNSRKASKRWLLDQVSAAAGPRPFAVTGAPPLPDDFAVDPDHAKSVLVRFS
ncbi:MAG: class I SAM-dependent methyltransferase [Phycisphaerae bacterium]|nr:class I SAM-dependent methyltransferase [Phycisphaerae bacterium]